MFKLETPDWLELQGKLLHQLMDLLLKVMEENKRLKESSRSDRNKHSKPDRKFRIKH